MDKYVSICESPVVLSDYAIPLCMAGLSSTFPQALLLPMGKVAEEEHE